MTDNERIAKWRGYIYVDQRIKQPFPTDGISGWRDGLHGKDVSIAFDTDITLWHGKDGVLAEIEKRVMQMTSSFLLFLEDDLADARAWSVQSEDESTMELLQVEAAQLTAALVKVLDDDN